MPDPVTAARVFLGISVAVFLVVYAVPLALAPLRWARWFRWRLPQGDPGLTVYFGRCTGVLALAVIVAVLPAVRDPRAHLDRFELVAWATGLMTVLHVWGAVRRTQPWTEDLEIVLYGAVFAISTWLRLALA
jgi:hypothetical protein